MANNYEMVFTKTIRIIREASNAYEAEDIAKAHCPEGFEVEDVRPIKSREHWKSVKREMAAQIMNEIPILQR